MSVLEKVLMWGLDDDVDLSRGWGDVGVVLDREEIEEVELEYVGV
ncbi:hypothetical protein [Bacillus pumilus]|nr:hypothetical protein [Bacillus pumilus]